MKLQILNEDVVTSVPLWSVESYLKFRGWKHQGYWGGNAAIHEIHKDGRNWELLVPLRDTVSDYSEVMERLISVVAQVESRVEYEVYVDLKSTGSDVVRLASTNGFGSDGMSLASSSGLYGDARDLFASAARAAERPQASYVGRFSGGITEYLDSVTPVVNGQSGHVLTLQSPVPPNFGSQIGLDNQVDESFPRRATMTLASALERTASLIEYVHTQQKLPENYDADIAAGFSANLCDNVASLAKAGHGIDISILWAPTRPAEPLKRPFRFSQHSIDFLQEVANDIRRKQPTYDVRVIAHVFRLERDPNQFDGQAMLVTVWENRLAHMNVKFDPPAYDEVIKAFQDRSRISVQGDVHPVGRSFELLNPRNLTVQTSTE